jgi:hypothetical protein
MSDSFGATDLDADMPGIGAAPGNARGAPQGLPSQLQALVQRFAQTSQGKPNPKFLPPPPGQGGQQQGKAPKLGPVDPPNPTAYSIAPVPANAPRPPASFNPYMPPVPRDSDQWGKPDEFPRLPQSFELPGMYQNLGGYFAQHGGFASAPMGRGAAAYAAAYQEAFHKGQVEKMQMAKEQLALHSQQLEDIERARAIEYADVFARHHEMGDDTTATHDDLWKVAVEHGDKDVIAMIEGGASAEKVRRFLADHEAHIRALSAANKKSTEQEEADGLYGLKPPSGEGGAGGDASKPYDPYGPGANTPATGAAPAPASGGQVAGPGAPSGDRAPNVGDPLEPDKKPSSADEVPEALKGIDPAMAAAAAAIYRGETPTGMGKVDAAHAVKYANVLRDETAKILADPNLKPGQYGDAVRKRLGPEAAAAMEGIADYRLPPGSTSGYGKQGDFLRGLEAIIAKDRPNDPAHGVHGFVAGYYHDRDVFRTSPAKSTILLRTKDMANQMDNINNDLLKVQKKLEARGVKATDINLRGAVELLVGDEDMTRLMSDLGSYSTAYNVVVSGGHATLGGSQAVDAYFKPYAPLATIRNVMKGHVPSAQGILQGLHNEWESIGGKPDDMPRGDASVERRIDDVGKMDVVTGATPYKQIVNHNGVPLMWTGKNQFDRNAPENWVDPKSTRD